ncbi:hypothetical protein ACOME3_003136 [Neoechinorhynchus agilis]
MKAFRSGNRFEKHFNSKNVRLLRRSRLRFRQQKIDLCRNDHQALNKTPLAQHPNVAANWALLQFLSSHETKSYLECLRVLLTNNGDFDVVVAFNYVLVECEMSGIKRELDDVIEKVYEERDSLGVGEHLPILYDDISYFNICLFYAFYKYSQTDISSALIAINDLCLMIDFNQNIEEQGEKVAFVTPKSNTLNGTEDESFSEERKLMALRIRFHCHLMAAMYPEAIKDYEMIENIHKSGYSVNYFYELQRLLQIHIWHCPLDLLKTFSVEVTVDGLIEDPVIVRFDRNFNNEFVQSNRTLELKPFENQTYKRAIICMANQETCTIENDRSIQFKQSDLKRALLLLRLSESQIRAFCLENPMSFPCDSISTENCLSISYIHHHRTSSLVIRPPKYANCKKYLLGDALMGLEEALKLTQQYEMLLNGHCMFKEFISTIIDNIECIIDALRFVPANDVSFSLGSSPSPPWHFSKTLIQIRKSDYERMSELLCDAIGVRGLSDQLFDSLWRESTRSGSAKFEFSVLVYYLAFACFHGQLVAGADEIIRVAELSLPELSCSYKIRLVFFLLRIEILTKRLRESQYCRCDQSAGRQDLHQTIKEYIECGVVSKVGTKWS